MKNFLRQTNDPEVEEGLEETRPFFWFLILVLILLYGISISASPELREPARFIPYTTLYFIHVALHWYMPYLVTRPKRLAFYLVVQIFLAMLLILISQEAGHFAGALHGAGRRDHRHFRGLATVVDSHCWLFGIDERDIWADVWLGKSARMVGHGAAHAAICFHLHPVVFATVKSAEREPGSYWLNCKWRMISWRNIRSKSRR